MYHYIACVNINALFRELSLPLSMCLSLWSLYDTRRSIHPIPSTYSTTVGGQRAILSEVLLADLKEHAKIIFLTSSIPPWPTIVFVEKTRWEKIHEKMLSVNGTEPDVRRPWPLVTVATLVRAALLFNFILGRLATTVRLLHCSLTAQLAPANHLIKVLHTSSRVTGAATCHGCSVLQSLKVFLRKWQISAV